MTASVPLAQWRRRGRTLRFGPHEVFYVDEGEGDALLLLHGFPTASWDWAKLWPALAARYRCIAADHLGFGWSAKPRGHAYRIAEQADLQEALLASLGVARCRILAHDYGDTIAQELLARDPSGARIVSACLLNGGLFPETHRAAFVQRLLASPFGGVVARLMGRGAFERNMVRIFGRATPPTREELDGFWSLLEHGDGRAALPRLIHYMRERVEQRGRWVGALQSTRVPLRLVVGMEDPISGAHMAARYRELVPSPDVVELAGIGHYPQVEAPDAVLRAVLAHFER